MVNLLTIYDEDKRKFIFADSGKQLTFRLECDAFGYCRIATRMFSDVTLSIRADGKTLARFYQGKEIKGGK